MYFEPPPLYFSFKIYLRPFFHVTILLRSRFPITLDRWVPFSQFLTYLHTVGPFICFTYLKKSGFFFKNRKRGLYCCMTGNSWHLLRPIDNSSHIPLVTASRIGGQVSLLKTDTWVFNSVKNIFWYS